MSTKPSKPSLKRVETDKQYFLASLDKLDALNPATPQRTALLDTMIAQKVLASASASASGLTQYDHDRDREQEDTIHMNTSTPSLENPGSATAFSKVASGTWKVNYAPHMTTISSLLNGSFGVSYTLSNTNGNEEMDMGMDTEDGNNLTYGTITSHAKYQFPIVGTGYLSVSGTYGTDRSMIMFPESILTRLGSSLSPLALTRARVGRIMMIRRDRIQVWRRYPTEL